jgi:hypothetical protein
MIVSSFSLDSDSRDPLEFLRWVYTPPVPNSYFAENKRVAGNVCTSNSEMIEHAGFVGILRDLELNGALKTQAVTGAVVEFIAICARSIMVLRGEGGNPDRVLRYTPKYSRWATPVSITKCVFEMDCGKLYVRQGLGKIPTRARGKKSNKITQRRGES